MKYASDMEDKEMSQAIDLLKEWATHEPDRCSLGYISGKLQVLYSPGHWLGIAQDEIDWSGYARIQAAVQRAIASHKLACHLQLNYAGEEWYATLIDVAIQWHSIGQDPEPAIALLKAYVEWLKKSAAKRESEA